MFGSIKKAFFTELTILSSVTPLSAAHLNAISLSTTQLSATSLKFVSMTIQECKVRPEIVISLHFILFSIKTSKCSGSCNNIDNPYAELCVPDIVKNLMLKFSI